jgi:hypothetical protein
VKITKKYLRQVIQEELSAVMSEGEPWWWEEGDVHQTRQQKMANADEALPSEAYIKLDDGGVVGLYDNEKVKAYETKPGYYNLKSMEDEDMGIIIPGYELDPLIPV